MTTNEGGGVTKTIEQLTAEYVQTGLAMNPLIGPMIRTSQELAAAAPAQWDAYTKACGDHQIAELTHTYAARRLIEAGGTEAHKAAIAALNKANGHEGDETV